MFLCVLKLLLLFAIGANTVRAQCSVNEYCTSSCSSILNRFNTGNRPRICNWAGPIPQVCCPRNTANQASPVRTPAVENVLAECSVNEYCTSSCSSILNRFNTGNRPKICNWAGPIPQVCCPRNTANQASPVRTPAVENVLAECPVNEYCSSSCSSILNRFNTGNRPRICNWAGPIPQVCCPRNTANQASPVRTPVVENVLAECPVNEYCTSSCSSILNRFNTGNRPKICNWAGPIPQVCCPRNTGNQVSPVRTPVAERRSNQISSISPDECGVRIQDSKAYADFYNQKVLTPEGKWENISSILAVGGTNATGKWPWMVAIFDEDKEKQLCGGTVINNRHIITASHCFDDKSLNPDMYTVQVGEINILGYNSIYKVQEIKLHENYRPGLYYNDIAIIKLAEPLRYDATPICLPKEDIVSSGDNVTVLGWGDLAYRGRSTTTLQEVPGIPIVGNRECNIKFRRLPSAPFPRGVTQDFICAGLEEGGKDACQGDSGGPLLREFSEQKFALVGIVSFGVKCAEPGFPGVYTKVSAHIPWIARNIRAPSRVAPARQRGNNLNNRRPNTGRIVFRHE